MTARSSALTRRAVGIAATVCGLALLCSAATGMADQRTDTLGADCVLFHPSTSADGARVAFESTCDLTGENADGNREIFQVNAAGAIVQLTDSAGCTNAAPSSNASGTAIAFESDCDYIQGNADGSLEMFVVAGGVVKQLTDGTACSSFAPSMNETGNLVIFDSDCNFLFTNVDRGSEIFRVSTTGTLKQLTSDATGFGCTSQRPSSNGAGTLASFESDCDLTGENPDHINEIFQVTGQGVVSQLTHSPSDDCMSSAASSDADGSLVAFTSDCDYTGANPDGSLEVFRVSPQGVVEQLSDDLGTSDCESSDPVISADGSAVWFVSYCDLDGANGDGSFEVFRATAGGSKQITVSQSCTNLAPDTYSDSRGAVFGGDCDPDGSNGDGSDEIFDVSLCFCGAPFSQFAATDQPVATDALVTLRAATGLGSCTACDCDVDSSGAVVATDALIILKAAVGQTVNLACP